MYYCRGPKQEQARDRVITANTDGNPLIAGQTHDQATIEPRLACDSDNVLYFFLSVFFAKKNL
jgi:hypothetical protein